jgi:hypothetical protein
MIVIIMKSEVGAITRCAFTCLSNESIYPTAIKGVDLSAIEELLVVAIDSGAS